MDLEDDFGEGEARGLSGEGTLSVGAELELESDDEKSVGSKVGGIVDEGDDVAGEDGEGDWEGRRFESGLNLDILFCCTGLSAGI